ncbi:MAG: hypothetical protein KAT07_02585 [Calditrichia bacterium]|nr:hypothetical protein [Calditrichia bacterium]
MPRDELRASRISTWRHVWPAGQAGGITECTVNTTEYNLHGFARCTTQDN